VRCFSVELFDIVFLFPALSHCHFLFLTCILPPFSLRTPNPFPPQPLPSFIFYRRPFSRNCLFFYGELAFFRSIIFSTFLRIKDACLGFDFFSPPSVYFLTLPFISISVGEDFPRPEVALSPDPSDPPYGIWFTFFRRPPNTDSAVDGHSPGKVLDGLSFLPLGLGLAFPRSQCSAVGLV